MSQRWELIKERMKIQTKNVADLADMFEKVNMNDDWVGWCYDASGVATISPDSQVILINNGYSP